MMADWTLWILLAISVFALTGLAGLGYHLNDIEKIAREAGDEDRILHLVKAKQFNNAAIVIASILILVAVYFLIVGSVYEGHFQEWLNLAVRWMHITFGIAWIGSSFYFISLENGLNRTKDLRDELAGDYWAIHGGGFYYLEKYKVAPRVIPKELHWFKYEAYFTWISGMALLLIVYYFNAKGMLVDTRVREISTQAAAVLGLGSLAAGWIVYDRLCKTALVRQNTAFAVAGFFVATAFAWLFTEVFAPRAAFIHFGALIGTIMAGNVFFIIIPAQKAMVKAAREGTLPDPELGKHAGLRSLHNNYLTLPVLFVMISNHFPSTFGHDQPWAILAGLSLGSAGIKHYLNLREKGRRSVWVMPLSVLLLLGLAMVTAPEPKGGSCDPPVTFTQVFPIFQARCQTCHSARPTDAVYTSAPNGVKYDTPEEIQNVADKILQRVVITETMPLNNLTGMTPEERDLIRCWIEQGAGI